MFLARVRVSVRLWRLYTLATVALCLCNAFARALTVTRGEITSIPAEHRTGSASLVQDLLVLQPENTAEAVQGLVLGTSCDVYVDYAVNSECTSCVATVRFLGTSRSVLNRYSVSARDASLSIEGTSSDLRIEVILHRASSLRSLTLEGTSDVVVGDNTMAQDNASASVSIVVTGVGSIYLPEQATYNVKQFVVKVVGSGDVSIPGKQINADDVDVQVQGSGSICLAVQNVLVKGSTSLQGTSSGDISVNAAHFKTERLAVAVQGSGDVSFSQPGSCNEATVTVAGAGDVHIGNVRCIDVDVELAGSGNVVVQSQRSLSGNRFGSGDIYYQGEEPEYVTEKRIPGSSRPHLIAEPYRGQLPLKPCLIQPRRPRQESPMAFKPSQSSPWKTESGWNTTWSTPEPYSPPSSTPAAHTGGVIVRVRWLGLGLLVIAVVLALYEFQGWRRRHRGPNERSPLLGNDVPVYI
ncbi:hypothetical protein Poli38472_010842 [Pythium oligandrum]|uniref:Putative auto-transporter adhesin head GIN domain-containing protein n=1 Tax=Pythium oligandrum TaxID=41045 RepID=A0A8K1CE58_PYTOL|nr:hypothetical protein Poli38472_010842 [Pythium oligandrum]|eukprot:TMW61779.1 hypothetical protein Poli38472_010842 [Pythium oligandrum]